jgi:transposase InsO family protein
VRQIKDIKLTDPVLVELAQKGAKHVDTYYTDKIQIDFERPWECLQSDARALPICVTVDGEVCICVLIVIIDAFSRYVLDWRLVAKRGKNAEGEWDNVDFTGKDVREMLGTVMLKYKRRPWFIYTDNGSQFRALEPYLPFLLNYDEKGLQLVNTAPYRPQGRGIIERTLGITDTYICEFEGSFSKDTLANREKARREKLRSFEWLQERLAYYFNNWNELNRE